MTAIQKKGCLNSFHLKLIAIVTMTIDHVGAVLFPTATIGGLEYLRAIGRLSFPIFCFLIVEGFYHTRNVKKYMMRLLLFALVSEYPFDLCFNYTDSLWSMQNIFFTLFLGLLTIYLFELVKKKWGEGTTATNLVQFSVMLILVWIAVLCKTDYDGMGVIYILILYLFRRNTFLLFAVMAGINILSCGIDSIQNFSVLSVLLIGLYNGERGPSMKYFFYVYYPLHLAIITVIYYYMNGFMPTKWFPM